MFLLLTRYHYWSDNIKGFKDFTGFKGFKGWQTAGLDAQKKPLMYPWGACWLRDEACQENV